MVADGLRHGAPHRRRLRGHASGSTSLLLRGARPSNPSLLTMAVLVRDDRGVQVVNDPDVRASCRSATRPGSPPCPTCSTPPTLVTQQPGRRPMLFYDERSARPRPWSSPPAEVRRSRAVSYGWRRANRSPPWMPRPSDKAHRAVGDGYVVHPALRPKPSDRRREAPGLARWRGVGGLPAHSAHSGEISATTSSSGGLPEPHCEVNDRERTRVGRAHDFSPR